MKHSLIESKPSLRTLKILITLVMSSQLLACAWFSSGKQGGLFSSDSSQFAVAAELDVLPPPPPPDHAIVYFYRVGLHPASESAEVLVGGKYVYRAREANYTFAYVRTGYKKIRVQWEEKSKIAPKEWIERIDPGKVYFVKVGGLYPVNNEVLGNASGARLTVTIDDKWQMNEMKNCCRNYAKPEFPQYD
jgi:hypothetical protein